MTNTTLFRQRVKESGLKYSFLAENLGITTYALQLKIDNKNEFKASEVKVLCDLLHISKLTEKEDIFFADNVDE